MQWRLNTAGKVEIKKSSCNRENVASFASAILVRLSSRLDVFSSIAPDFLCDKLQIGFYKL